MASLPLCVDETGISAFLCCVFPISTSQETWSTPLYEQKQHGKKDGADSESSLIKVDFGASFILIPLETEMEIQLQIWESGLLFTLLIFDPRGSNYWDPSATEWTTRLLLRFQNEQQCHTPNVSSVHRQVTAHQDPPPSNCRADMHKKENENWLFPYREKGKTNKPKKKVGKINMKQHPPYHLKPGAGQTGKHKPHVEIARKVPTLPWMEQLKAVYENLQHSILSSLRCLQRIRTTQIPATKASFKLSSTPTNRSRRNAPPTQLSRF